MIVPTGLLSTSLFHMPRRIKQIYLSLNNDVRDSFRNYDFIYTEGSVSYDNSHWWLSFYWTYSRYVFIFSEEFHALYLALNRVEMADDNERNFIIFYDSKSALQAILGRNWTHPLVLKRLECLHWIVQYQEKRILFYWIPSHIGIRGEKMDSAAKAGLLRRVTKITILFGDLKKHINYLWMAGWVGWSHRQHITWNSSSAGSVALGFWSY